MQSLLRCQSMWLHDVGSSIQGYAYSLSLGWCASCCGSAAYFNSLFFYLDLVSALSLIPDVMWLFGAHAILCARVVALCLHVRECNESVCLEIRLTFTHVYLLAARLTEACRSDPHRWLLAHRRASGSATEASTRYN